jgi:hypothetical protein
VKRLESIGDVGFCGSIQEKQPLGFANRFRPTYALAIEGHPSDALCPGYNGLEEIADVRSETSRQSLRLGIAEGLSSGKQQFGRKHLAARVPVAGN